MAMTVAERKRNQIAREKAALKTMPDLTYALDLKPPFFEFLNSHGDLATIDAAFDIMGVSAPNFKDDADPKSYSGMAGDDDGEDSPYHGYKGSLGRAELMVSCLIDATVTLSGIINEYKREQITARLNEIEQADLADPATRKAAMGEVVRLNKLLERLTKSVRQDFPQWKLKGE